MTVSTSRSSVLVLVVVGGITAAAAPNLARADTITGYINSNTSYSQTSNSAPTSPFGYFFAMGAFFSGAGDFTTGSATYPGAASPQALSSVGTTELQYQSGYYPSLGSMQTAYPFGTYSMTVSGPAGTQTSAMIYSANPFTGDVPYLTNYSSLAGLNSKSAFTADYNGFTANPATNEAFTFFTVYNATTGAVVLSNDFQSPGSTSTIIPANTLAPGTTYDFELNFDDRITGTDAPDSTFTSQDFDVRTDGSFTTAAAVPEPASMALLGTGLVALASRRRHRKNA